MPIIPIPRRLRQKNHELEASQGYIAIPCLNKNNNNYSNNNNNYNNGKNSPYSLVFINIYYISCTKGFHCDASTHSCNVSPSTLSIFSCAPFLLLKTIVTGFIALFPYRDIKYFDCNYHPPSLCPFTLSPPNGTHSQTEPVLFLLLIFQV
jgi:hypothetical protein